MPPVLITFLAGIGFGSLHAHRLWRRLWLIEAAIGAFGVVFALGAARFGPWVSSAVVLGGDLRDSVLLCVLLLCVPSFLIGCSLPLFGGYLERLGSARAFHKAYALYNVGAAVTVLVVEFLLLRLMGIRATVLTMAAVNGLTSLGLAFGFPELRRDRPARPEPQRFEKREILALALASVASAVFQLLMVKLAEFVLAPFRETFALVIAVVLIGIAAGSAMVERLRLDFARLVLIGLAGLAWIAGGFGLVVYAYASVHDALSPGHLTAILLKFATLVALMGLPAAAFGATIPALIRARGDLARDSGRLLFLSSMANVFGFLLMAFALHRFLDYGVLVLVVAGLACASALTYQRFRGRPALAAAGLFGLAIVLHVFRWDEHLLYLDSSSFESARVLKNARLMLGSVERFKGYQDVFSLVENGDDVSFFVNGYVSVQLGSATEPMVGALPALLAPRSDRAMVLGFGSGMTAGALGLLFDRVDAVEINPAVVENLWRMKRWNFDVGSMRNVTTILDDGMHFMRVSRNKYTLIVNTVTTPLYFSGSKLYTRDFFETVRERLTPDGLYVTWLDSGIGERGADITLKTLRGSFKNCWLIALRAEYYLLVCSNETIALRQPRLIAENRTLAAYFFDQAGTPAEWLPYSLLHTRPFDLIGNQAVPVNTLDYPALEFEIARSRRTSIDGFVSRLVSGLSEADVCGALGTGMACDPMVHLLYIEMLMGSSEILDRWSNILGPRFENFRTQRRKAMLQHLAGWALFANTSEAHEEYGWFLGSLGRDEAAIEEYRRALELEPRNAASRLLLGSALEGLGDLDSAEREYATVLQRFPSQPHACLGLGKIALKRGRYQEAQGYLSTAASFYTKSAEAYYALGQAEEGMGRTARARRTLERALALEPGNDEIAGALARVSATLAK